MGHILFLKIWRIAEYKNEMEISNFQMKNSKWWFQYDESKKSNVIRLLSKCNEIGILKEKLYIQKTNTIKHEILHKNKKNYWKNEDLKNVRWSHYMKCFT